MFERYKHARVDDTHNNFFFTVIASAVLLAVPIYGEKNTAHTFLLPFLFVFCSK